ncbi:MAG: polyphosphate:AMP phosphotransferase [Geminicoccaceae bacterium]
MFESAVQDHKLSKEAYRKEEPKLRSALIEAQLELAEGRQFAVVVIVTGMDGAGKGAVIRRLYEWLDPRHLRSNAYDAPTDEERQRPRMWRYWRDLPPRGDIGIVFGSWYNEPLTQVLRGDLDGAGLEQELAGINRFEKMLADEGVLLLKFLLVVSAKEQRRRLAEVAKGDNLNRHVLEEWGNAASRRRGRRMAELVVNRTSTGHAPWIVIPSDDGEYRDLMAGRTLADALRRRLEAAKPVPATNGAVLVPSLDHRTVLDSIDLSRRLESDAYKVKLDRWQDRLAQLTESKAFRGRSLVVVFEGNDAAGKGGSIRRVTAALDPRRFRVNSVAAPTDEERAQPYLWRFWRHIPRLGHTAIFDRSWYGRVLVERVEGFASEAEWLRAYGEINEFEEELSRDGVIVAKFWLAISKAEQLRRFKEREKIPFKQFKITPEDWRNRDKWDLYAQAVNDMVDRTSTPTARWTLVSAEDKRWARVAVLKTLCRTIENAIG